MAELVSLRAAAAALGLPKSTLSQLLKRESTLAAAVVGTGARGSLQIDMEKLKAAWAALQSPGDEEGLSDRAKYDRARRVRLWWECCAAQQQVADLEDSLVDAEEAAAVLAADHAEVHQAAAAWADAIASEVVGMDQADAAQHLQSSIVAQLTHLSTAHTEDDGPAPSPTLAGIAVPDPLPGLWALRAELENCKGRLAQLHLQQQRGELEPATAVADRFSVAGRLVRDAWLRVGEQLALRTRRLASPQSVKTAALQLLSANGLI